MTSTIVVAKVISKQQTKDRKNLLRSSRPKTGSSYHGPIYKWTLKVEKGVKGKYRPGDELVLVAASRGKDVFSDDGACVPSLNFEIEKTYLVFVGSYHPKGYQEVNSQDDPVVTDLEKMLSKQ